MSIDLLALGPHPDDVELSCGGWLALAAERGQDVQIVDLTHGEAASNGSPEERAAEAAAAAHVLGTGVRKNLGLPDGGLSAADPDQLSAIVATIRAHRPGLLLAPHPGARHPDHQAAGQLAAHAQFWSGVRTFRPDLGAAFRPRRLIHYPQRHEVRPDFVVDVGAAYSRKLEAIRCHQSQFGSIEEGTPTLINQPLGIQAFEVRDRYWGASIGVAYGEPYLLGAPVPMADPVGHFTAHGAVPVLVPTR